MKMIQRKAFTLIELLIVIGIIITLAVFGIGSYSAARQNMTLDLEADRLVALIHTLREQSRTSPKCAGITFEKGKMPTEISAKYQNSKQKCAAKVNVSDVVLAPEIILSALKLDDTDRDVFSVLFVPPQGEAEFMPESSSAQLTLKIKSKNYLSRDILINRISGKIEKQ